MQEQIDRDIVALRALCVTLKESNEGYSDAARESDELFRPIFLGRAKERAEMANEFEARILALGGVVEGETDALLGLASGVRMAGRNGDTLVNVVEEFEASLRGNFLNALNDEALSADTRAFLKSQFLTIKRSQDEVRKLRREFASPGD